MPLTLNPIDPDASIELSVPIFNNNFASIQQLVNDITQVLDPATNTLYLTNLTTLPNNSAEVHAIVMTANAGFASVLAPNGGPAVYSLDSAGRINALRIIVTGTGTDKSELGDAVINGDIILKEKVTLEKVVDFRSVNSIIQKKSSVFPIVNANIGASAPSPVNISTLGETILFNCSNGNTPLSGSKDIKIDTTTLLDGQEFKLMMLIDNAGSGVKFYNGTSGNEYFAVIDPSSPTGFVSVSHTVLPEFDTTSGNYCWMKVRWMQIAPATYRLVILDYNNIANI
jgi:hypothetical protein